ncbi:hypothetical protein [Erythrobacter colymbi]|uniref:hypothetical protein n=1 Tax=Erythrobacter colymbi TaxID=1161202 RepID=UPI000A3AD126|nr:hypothetical protein [Erythrobacter colymbi]
MSDTTTSQLEILRADLKARIDTAIDAAICKLSGQSAPATVFKVPTFADGQDPRNKNGMNLTPRGVEILYRLFDDGAGYNRAAKALSISQGAAKNRKQIWTKLGGLNRTKQVIDIDVA